MLCSRSKRDSHEILTVSRFHGFSLIRILQAASPCFCLSHSIPIVLTRVRFARSFFLPNLQPSEFPSPRPSNLLDLQRSDFPKVSKTSYFSNLHTSD